MFNETDQSMGRNKMAHRGMGFAQLDLTDSQKQQMLTIMTSSKGNNQNRMSDEERATRQAEMQALMYSDPFDEDQAKALISQHQSKMVENRLEMMKAKHQAFQLLTDEQKTQYGELKAQRQNR